MKAEFVSPTIIRLSEPTDALELVKLHHFIAMLNDNDVSLKMSSAQDIIEDNDKLILVLHFDKIQ